MSNSAIDAVFLYSHAKGSDRMVLTVIADAINDDTGITYPKLETIADYAGISARQVSRVIMRLVALSELVIIENGHSPHTYWIPMLHGEEGYAPEDCNEPHTCSGRHTPAHITRGKVKRAARDKRRKTQPKPAPVRRPKETPARHDTDVIPTSRHDTAMSSRHDTAMSSRHDTAMSSRHDTAMSSSTQYVPKDYPKITQRERPSVDEAKKRTAPSWTQVMAWERSDAGREWYRYNLRGRDPQLLPSGQRFDAYEKATLHGEVQS